VVKLYVGITDSEWFKCLRAQPGLEEANFWQPGGRSRFRVLQPGELFLFKLHSPLNFIVGGGVFAHDEILPISLAWRAFGVSNGAASLQEMRERVGKYRSVPDDRGEDYQIGCRIITSPFFFGEAQWLPVPSSWSRYTQQGRAFDTDTVEGRDLWEQIQERIPHTTSPGFSEQLPRYGEPTLIRPRLGQGTFRITVTSAYQRRCSVTGEKTLPVLDAAHIGPYGMGGVHEVSNGLLLRQDIHTLFDLGYVTIDQSRRVVVSKRIKRSSTTERITTNFTARV
jgi:putative restriction endonuclease